MRTVAAIAVALMSGALALSASDALAAAEEESASGFLATVPGMGSLLDLTYGSTAEIEAGSANDADLGFRDRLFLGGLDGVGATLLHSDNFRVGVRTRGTLRDQADGSSNLATSDMLDVGAFGEFSLDDWTLSASVGQGLGDRGGFAGDLGLKWAARFADRWRVELGPEFSWASEDYLSGLADFTPRRVPGRGLQLYDPTPGARELTFSGSVEYSISDSWTVGGMVGAQRMMNDGTETATAEETNEFFGGVSLGIRF